MPKVKEALSAQTVFMMTHFLNSSSLYLTLGILAHLTHIRQSQFSLTTSKGRGFPQQNESRTVGLCER